MAQLYGTQIEIEAKKPMARWKKFAIGAAALFAAFVGLKFTDDSFADLSKSCSFYGGTPANRSLFTSTASCTWTNQMMQRQVNFAGTPQRGINVAEKFCHAYKGRLVIKSTADPVVCEFAKT